MVCGGAHAYLNEFKKKEVMSILLSNGYIEFRMFLEGLDRLTFITIS